MKVKPSFLCAANDIVKPVKKEINYFEEDDSKKIYTAPDHLVAKKNSLFHQDESNYINKADKLGRNNAKKTFHTV